MKKTLRGLFILSLCAVLAACSPAGGGVPAETAGMTDGGSPTDATGSFTDATGEEPTEAPTHAPTLSIAPNAEAADVSDEVEVVMSFVGDCLPGSEFGTHAAGSFNAFFDANEPSYFLGGVQEVFANDDITVADCETVLTDRALTPVAKEEPAWWYYGPAAAASVFSEGGVEIASVANNHTGDYGTEGFNDTVAALSAVGVQPGVDMEPVYYEVKGVTVGVLCAGCWNSYHASRIRDTLAVMSERSDIQVVVPHGGGMNTYIPDEWRVNEFRSFIEAGAEVVAAGHPHALQPLESYKGGVIVYSLGNFCYGGSTLPENTGVILSVSATFKGGEYDYLSYELIPCYLFSGTRNNYRPEIVPPYEAAYGQILDFMYGLADAPCDKPRYAMPEDAGV